MQDLFISLAGIDGLHYSVDNKMYIMYILAKIYIQKNQPPVSGG